MPFLHYQKYGDSGPVVVILHGLFGSSKNWVSLARHLSGSCIVYTPDARNHGASFHTATHTTDEMAGDLNALLDHLNVRRAILIGHSMGGLTAMRFTLSHPSKVAGLVVVDIAPRVYNLRYTDEFAALNTDLSQFKSRREIDTALANHVKNTPVRQFLQTNIESTPEGHYRWVLNVSVLEKSRERASLTLEQDEVFSGAALFLRATNEKFIRDEDLATIYKHFTAAQVVNFTKGNHWLHVTEAQKFLTVVSDFISSIAV